LKARRRIKRNAAKRADRSRRPACTNQRDRRALSVAHGYHHHQA
jgi:hypothetical protein